ncbi:MAG TPA: hypothetical protein VM509_13790, partial [Planctomycetota bacterium]|nr:hypothetical protein [Planctomycetota bacterium]
MRDLVGGSFRSTWRRELLQDVALTLGLVFIALALPTSRLTGDGPSLVQATARGEWFSTHIFLQPLSRALALLPGFGAERAWALIAAACWAGSYFPLS